MPGIEPGAFHMQSERSTTEPHPRMYIKNVNQFKLLFSQPCTWSSIYVQVNECAKWSDRFSKLVNGDSKLILFHKTLIVLIGL